MARVLVPVVQDYFLLHSVETIFGADPASHPMGTGENFLGVKRPEREADHSPPSTAEVENDGAVLPFSHMSSWRNA
jgi:hypothetical protein